MLVSGDCLGTAGHSCGGTGGVDVDRVANQRALEKQFYHAFCGFQRGMWQICSAAWNGFLGFAEG